MLIQMAPAENTGISVISMFLFGMPTTLNGLGMQAHRFQIDTDVCRSNRFLNFL